jgi:pullulanase
LFDAYHLALGSCLNYFKFNEPTQTLNYVECHDNYTFYDFAKTYLGMKDEKEIYDRSKLALSLVILSEGIPFIHAGQEFLRTKQGVENSYNTVDDVNKIDYDRRDKYLSLVNTLRYLISIRKEYACFRYSKGSEIKRKMHPLEELIDRGTPAYIICENDYNIIVLVANNYIRREIELPNYKMIFDSDKCCDIQNDKYIIEKPGVYLFKGEKEKWI